jgi:hypothetical protein
VELPGDKVLEISAIRCDSKSQSTNVCVGNCSLGGIPSLPYVKLEVKEEVIFIGEL